LAEDAENHTTNGQRNYLLTANLVAIEAIEAFAAFGVSEALEALEAFAELVAFDQA
jgi:hypothetical protein